VQKFNGLLVNNMQGVFWRKPFQLFVSALDPRYRLPTCQAMSGHLIPDRYEAVKRTVVDHITKAGSNAI